MVDPGSNPNQPTTVGPSDSRAAMDQAIEMLRGNQRFLLTGHMRPDGDCIGAQAALCRVLESLGKEVWILNPDPPEAQFDYLSRACRFGAFKPGGGAESIPVHDVCVMLDGSELSRTGALEEPLRNAASKKMIIDHHIHHGDAWWDAAYVDVSASATGLLVGRVAKELGVELDRVAALGVYTSIVTDTGWFKYSNTDAETLGMASELVEAGVKPHEVYQSIYQRNGKDQPVGIGRVLSTLEYHADGRLAVVSSPPPTEGQAALADGDEVLDILRSVESVEVVLFLRGMAQGGSKLSARSKADYNVNALARRFGGGGHAKASGATLEDSLDAAKAKLVEAVLADFAAEGGAASSGAQLGRGSGVPS